MAADSPADRIVTLKSPKPESRRRGLPREGILWILVTVALIVTGLFKGINLIILLAHFMIAVILLNWWLSRRHLLGLRGIRLPGGPIFAGEPTLWYVEVKNDAEHPLTGWIVHDFGPNHELGWFGARLDGKQALCLRAEVNLPQRGRYLTGPLLASTRFPFGLYARVLELAPGDEKIVLPKVGYLEMDRFRLWLSRASRGDGRLHHKIRHLVSSEADVHGLRPFRTGDSPRWIHWRTSARRNELMVREFEDSSPPNIIIVVEAWLPVEPQAADSDRLERLVSLAATVCKSWCKEPEARLRLAVYGAAQSTLDWGGGADHARRGLEQLAVVDGVAKAVDREFLKLLPRTTTAQWLVVTSNSQSNLGSELAHWLGRPVAVLSPDDRNPWYHPPA